MKNFLFLIVGLFLGGAIVYFYDQYSGFPGDENDFVNEPTLINAETANTYFQQYHKIFSRKLRTKTENGTETIKTVIIRQHIIEHFKELVEREPDSETIEPAGLALTFGRNSKGATLLVTALVCEAGTAPNDIRNTRQLLPRDATDTNYIYDHLDLCPTSCPKNTVSLSAEEYYRDDPNRQPPYNGDTNYWIRQH